VINKYLSFNIKVGRIENEFFAIHIFGQYSTYPNLKCTYNRIGISDTDINIILF